MGLGKEMEEKEEKRREEKWEENSPKPPLLSPNEIWGKIGVEIAAREILPCLLPSQNPPSVEQLKIWR